MASKEKVPAIRFKSFTDEWEEKKLGDIGQTFTGLSGKTKEDFGHGDGRFVTYMNVFSNPVANLEGTESIEIDHSQSSVQKGDVLFTTSSETPEDVGMSSVWLGSAQNVYLNSFCFGFRPSERVDLLYLAYSLRSPSFREKVVLLAQGISRYNISKNKALNIKIAKPRLSEQIQIGNYFKELDSLIIMQEQKLEKTQQLKAAMLEKMFPKADADTPDIRFTGFTDKWERKTFGDVANFNIPTNSHSRSMMNDDVGTVKNIHYGDILVRYNSILNVQLNTIPFLSDDKSYNYKKSFLKDGDIIFADAAEDQIVGKAVEIIEIGEEQVVAGLHTIVARPTMKFSPYFFGYYINSKSYHRQLLTLMQGTKVLSISKFNLRMTEICYPKSFGEQQKIGSYFQNLDRLIDQSHQKITKLKNLKQALLQKMFI